MATIDLGKIAITPEGQWSSGKYYEKLSLVIFNGQSYLSLRDTTGDNPETSRSDWMQITSRGESLYQMMVREGKFVGTEEEFTQQYIDSLKACADASDEVRAALSDILDEMDRVRAEISEVMVEEDIRIKNETKREAAEINRRNAEITRGVEERNRQEAEQRREQSMQQIQNDAKIALAMAAEAQQKAEDAILNEEERVKAENQRKIDEATRIQHEEQRINDEAMRRSREADRQESEDIRQKNEGDRILAEREREESEGVRQNNEDGRILAEREREEIMKNLVEELKALAANKFKIVDVLPEVGEFAVIYLVPSTTPSDNDVYDEWAYVSGKWEHIGSTRFKMDDYYTKEEVEAALNTKQNTIIAGEGISIEGNVISAIGGGGGDIDSLITPITYAELVALRGSSSLVAGMQYRITDYACTTTQASTQSAGHPFDIIVTADSENTLNEEARAIQHEGDTYFADCDLNAWKIWYCLDNDSTRFAWADSTNGKGVIYRMIDEWNNDVPYDFKNIMYNGSWRYWAYTFNWINDASDNTCEDLSVAQYAHTNNEGGYSHTYGNVIESYGISYGIDDVGNYGSPIQLNKCVFLNSESSYGGIFNGCYSNTFSDNCYYNTFHNNCHSNTFGTNCHSNTFSDNCRYNTFGDSCSSNTFGNDCYSNTFEDSCFSNTFGNDCYSNTLGYNCCNNKFGSSCSYNNFGNTCSSNTFGNTCSSNIFGNSCKSNNFRINCVSNNFGNNCSYNTFGSDCYYDNFGNNCSHNTFGTSCTSNSFGNNCSYNILGRNCSYNNFGNNCSSNNFGESCSSNNFGERCSYIKFASTSSTSTNYNYYQYNHFGDGCEYLLFTGAETASSTTQVQNYNFAQGLQGTSSAYIEIDGVRSRAYETKVAKNSSGELKIYCEADLIQ